MDAGAGGLLPAAAAALAAAAHGAAVAACLAAPAPAPLAVAHGAPVGACALPPAPPPTAHGAAVGDIPTPPLPGAPAAHGAPVAGIARVACGAPPAVPSPGSLRCSGIRGGGGPIECRVSTSGTLDASVTLSAGRRSPGADSSAGSIVNSDPKKKCCMIGNLPEERQRAAAEASHVRRKSAAPLSHGRRGSQWTAGDSTPAPRPRRRPAHREPPLGTF